MLDKKNIFNIVLIIVVFALLAFVFFRDDSEKYVKEYNNKIEALEQKVDSLHSGNDELKIHSKELEHKVAEYDDKIKKLNTRIYVIKKQTQQKLKAVDSFGDDELEQFFTNRYRQHTDSIN